ncbi:MAG: hypothetical protein J3T61_04625, partial [Candidatus Brocadiales bacterium]|nr:hypothetical protein [Candidatus Bathyanammoxibius sp.]
VMNGFLLDILVELVAGLPVLVVILWVMWWRLNGLERRANERWATHHNQHEYVQETLTRHTGDIGELRGKAGI